MDMTTDDSDLQETPATSLTDERASPEQPEGERKLVDRILRTIKEDKKAHEEAFKRMRSDMFVATNGRSKSWPAGKYTANIIGRHVRQRTTSLYAKNPKATAKRREALDFAVWDENPQTLAAAMQLSAQAAATPAQTVMDPATGAVQMLQPQIPGLAEAQALVEDATVGMQRREQLAKFGRTLEVLFAHALKEQNPLEFKVSAKKMVRRACTTGVSYIELGFQREYGPRPESVNKLADDKARLEHLRVLAEEAQEGELDSTSAEIAELEAAVAAFDQEQSVLLREGLVFDFPPSTRVIPDARCTSLVGFIGAGHVTVEYLYSTSQVKETFGVDLDGKFTAYKTDGGLRDKGYDWEDDGEQLELPLRDEAEKKKDSLVCVWKHYDKPSGLVYYVADGHPGFLQPPAAPDVKVDDFWPLRALTFNDVENEDDLFPPSDVSLMLSMQEEINRSREGYREHRKARRPRWAYPNGTFDDDEIEKIQGCEPFEAVGLKMDPSSDISKMLQAFPVPGVDPNLYETGPFLTDMQLVGGMQAAQLGAVAKATATESAIAADSNTASDSSGVDDLDACLTWVARSSGQILLREMTPEYVVKIAGRGAMWPGLGGMEMLTPEDIADEVFLEVEAGSSGKPNQAVEIRNWKELLPFLLQMGSIPPIWLARETLRRLDDRLDLTEALSEGLPSIVAMNRGGQVATGNPETDPNQQGDKGGDKAPAPGGPVGSDAPMGDNRA